MRLAASGVVEPARGEVRPVSVMGVEQVRVLPSALMEGVRPMETITGKMLDQYTEDFFERRQCEATVKVESQKSAEKCAAHINKRGRHAVFDKDGFEVSYKQLEAEGLEEFRYSFDQMRQFKERGYRLDNERYRCKRAALRVCEIDLFLCRTHFIQLDEALSYWAQEKVEEKLREMWS